MKVYIVEMDRYADAGVATGPAFRNEADAEAFIEKHSPRTNFGPEWFHYELTLCDSLEAAEAELAAGT